MTKLSFDGFLDCPDDDGMMAHCQTAEEEIPINIFIDNYDNFQDIEEGCQISIAVCGVSGDADVYHSEEEYQTKSNGLAPIAMIPLGTFSIPENEDSFVPSPHIMFSGIVRDLCYDPNADENQPNYDLVVETYDLVFVLYIRHEGNIQIGDIVHGIAWLYGDIESVE